MTKKNRYTINAYGNERVKLKTILKQRNITQTELAKMTDLEIYQVSKICSGKLNDMLLSTALKICNALDVSFERIFGD
jgi:putative transcriptional regulator